MLVLFFTLLMGYCYLQETIKGKWLSGIGSACCNPSVWGDGIRGWLEDGSPPKEVARSLWCLHQPYGHVKPPLGDGMALGVG